MQFSHLACLCGFFFFWGVSQAENLGVPSNDSDRLRITLQQASETAESPFHLEVNCTDQKGIRSLELFPGGAAVWNRRSQIMLPSAARSTLLTTLVERGFPGFENNYGGQQQPAKSAAAARVTCRIRIEIQNIVKSSLQMAGGEQSAAFLNLAAELLDQAEQFIDSAVTPVDLPDALDKLYEGQLAPQVLRLRFMESPAKGDNNPGYILRLAGGDLSHQVYAPGKPVNRSVVKPLEHAQFMRLIAVMREEQFTSLPVNLWSNEPLELEVQVLAHKKVVLARRFSRLETARQEPQQQRFNKLLRVLRELAQQ